jgi:small subunit ribosomal protein S17
MKILTGKVVSAKMNKTVVVEVETTTTHPMYRKRITKSKRYHAHDEKGVKVGDVVNIAETKPMSKLKRFVVVEK